MLSHFAENDVLDERFVFQRATAIADFRKEFILFLRGQPGVEFGEELHEFLDGNLL